MKKFALIALLAAPSLAFAQQLSGLQNLLQSIGRLVDMALPIVVSIALLAFFWGLARFIFNAGNEGAREEAMHMMIWSIIALFVMVSVWGLVSFIGNSLNIGKENAPTVDVVPQIR